MKKKNNNQLKFQINQSCDSLFRSITRTTTEAILVIDRQGKVVYYNENFLRFWNIPQRIIALKDDKKLLARAISQLSEPKEFLAKVNYLYHHPAKESSDIIHFKDGRIFSRYSIPQKINGKIIGRVWRFQDITELTREKERLMDSEMRFRAIYEQSPVSIFLVGLDGRFLHVNKASVKMLGYNEEELKKMTFGDITHPDERKRDIGKIKEMIQNKITFYEVEKRYIRKDKRIVNVRIHATLVKDLMKKPLYFLTIVEDITEHKEYEEKIRQSEEKYSTLVENSNDAVIVIQDSKIKFANRNSEQMTGYTIEEVLNKSFLNLIAPKYRKMMALMHLKRMMGEKNIPNRYEFEIAIKGNGFMPVEVSASQINYEGRPASLAIIRDISRAKQVDKIKSEFISVASHQLRSPLTGIKWFSQLLADQKVGKLTDKQLDFIQQIYQSNERMIRLINDLLDVSHIETGQKFNIEKKSGDVIALIKNVILEQKISSPAKVVAIEVDKSCPAKLVIKYDQDKIYQVFSNLLNNSIKYSPRNSKITIGVDCRKDTARFFVQDFGFGIPKCQQDRIFQKFFRADNIATVSTEGTGLGLYIAKSIIEAHGGEIWFESQENKGTTFYFTLPLKDKKKKT